MKKLLNFSLLAILAASFVVTGCKKDDDSNPGGETTKQDGILPKKVVKIVKKNSGYLSATYSFDSEGRIASKTEKDGKYSDITTYAYTDNKVFVDGKQYGDIVNGRVVSLKGDFQVDYTYSSDGYIETFHCFNDWDDDIEFTDEKGKYTITNGNVTVFDGTDEDYDNWTTTLNYGSRLNNLNVDIMPIIYDDLELYLPGLIGKRCNNLPISCTRTIGTNKYVYVDEFTYTYDGDYLTKITDNYTKNGSDKIEIIYEIYYED